MGEKDKTFVDNSVDFRDAVMKLEKMGCAVYVRMANTRGPLYRVIGRTSAVGDRMKLGDLFRRSCPPVYMEDFAQALVQAREDELKDGFVVFTN